MTSPTGSPNRQYESMTRVTVGIYTVRVWRTELYFTKGKNQDIRTTVKAIEKPTMEKIGEALDKLPNIAAYEILDIAGDGGIVYPDWK